MLMLLAVWVTFLFASSMLAVLGTGTGGGLFVIVGRAGMFARAPMLVKAAVIVAAVMVAMAAFMLMLGMPIGRFMGRFIGRGKGKFRGEGAGVGRGNCRIALGLRLSGIGIPALAHMAAAFALAISSNWSLSARDRAGH